MDHRRSAPRPRRSGCCVIPATELVFVVSVPDSVGAVEDGLQRLCTALVRWQETLRRQIRQQRTVGANWPSLWHKYGHGMPCPYLLSNPHSSEPSLFVVDVIEWVT